MIFFYYFIHNKIVTYVDQDCPLIKENIKNKIKYKNNVYRKHTENVIEKLGKTAAIMHHKKTASDWEE